MVISFKNVNKLYHLLRKTSTRFIINYGGAGSSKSYSQTQFEISKLLESRQKLLVIRKVSNTLNDSVISLFWKFLKNLEGCELRKIDKIILLPNGSEILFKGLDDPEKIKSIAGITRIWIEEASELEEADFNQLNLRLRGAENLQMTLTFNPISETHWIKSRFFDKLDKDVTIFKTTYRDNKFIDDAYKKELEKYRLIDENYYNVYALGKWGSIKTGEELFHLFNLTQHVTNPETIKGYPIWLSFDQNRKPYSTCTIYQILTPDVSKDRFTHINVIDEICLPPPHNETQRICEVIQEKYPYRPGMMMFYTGDHAGKSKHQGIMKSSYTNHYDAVEDELVPYLNNASRKLFPPPPVEPRRFAVNKILSESIDIKLNIHEKCVNLIKDFEELQIGLNGWYDKNSIRKKGVETHGHCMDSFIYLLNAYDRNLFYNG